jgi:hypothetical protein
MDDIFILFVLGGIVAVTGIVTLFFIVGMLANKKPGGSG